MPNETPSLASLQDWERRVRRIAGCRICGNAHLEPVIDLGAQSLASLFNDGRPENRLETPIPLQVVRCQTTTETDACGFVQLTHTVPPDILYHDYGYRSGINTTMRKHLSDLVHEIESKVRLTEGDLVVDVGANDGTTLLSYAKPGLVRVGIEPSTIRPEIADPPIEYIPGVFNAKAFHDRFPDRQAQVLTTIAMFYDLDDPAQFCRDLSEVLADDGLWVLEMSYLGALLEQNAFDAMCHEHLGYYSLDVLCHVLEKTGFALHDLTFNDANGGSVRCKIRKRSTGPSVPPPQQARIDAALRDERRSGYREAAVYERFRRNVETIRQDLREILREIRSKGGRVYGYGASTKGNVLLQYCGVGPRDVIALAERNPRKVGRSTPGTHIPICSEGEMRHARPDYVLILPWHFLGEFMERERALRASGTRFIVPFPTVRVL